MANHTSLASLFTDIANAIRAKLGSSGRIVADNFPAAIQSIPTGSTPVLETVTKSYTPTETAQSDTITPGTGYDAIEEVDVTVGAIPNDYVGSAVTRRSSSDLTANAGTVSAPAGYYASGASKAVPAGTEGTPTATKGTVSNHAVTVTPSVQNSAGYISGGTRTGTGVQVSASELVSGTLNVDSSGTKDVTNYENASIPALTLPSAPASTASGTSKATIDRSTSDRYLNIPKGFNDTAQYYKISKVPNGSAGTPTASKGAVSNHQVTVTPSVQNTEGYISGGTKTGTGVVVTAAELVSGSETKTQNGTYDVTNLAELIVNVSGGGGSSMMVSTAAKTLAAAASSIQFTGLSGEPTSFVVTSAADQSTGGTKAVAVVYDGTSCHGIDLTTQAEADTGFTQSYSNGTLTITATTASFQANEYKLVYSYGGTGGNIGTADVQVGSGATSITFTGLSDEPEYFSCIFKSTFSTSNGYQRVMEVVYDGTNIYGHALDSSAHALTSWTWSYSNGSLTITSTGTNNGGYFHQPGYYQLTYAIGGDETLQTKTVTPTEQTQNVTADTAQGYTALKKVVVNPIPSEYIIPTGNLPITQNGNNIDVSQYATVSVNVGGGGSSMNAQSAQSTTRATSTSYTEVIALTCAASGTYDVYWSTFRSSTSGTWGSQLYIDNTAYGSAQTGSWSNHIQNIHLTNVQIDAGEEVAVRVRSSGSNYYGYVGTLTIIQKS